MTADYERGRDDERAEILRRFHEAEAIDRRHGFVLPGDSALAVFAWGLETVVGDRNRAKCGDPRGAA